MTSRSKTDQGRRARLIVAGTILIVAIGGLSRPLAQSLAARAVADVEPVAAASAPRTVDLLVGRSTIVTAAAPIARVSLTNSDVADALVTGPAQVLVHGKVPGAISMFVWERSGAIDEYKVTVRRDIAQLADQTRQLFPGEAISVEGSGKNIVLSGTVSSKDVADRAASLATGFVDKKEDVVDLLQINAPPLRQVLIRVRFAEVSRTALTQLGSSFFTGAGGYKGNGNVGQTSTEQYPVPMYDPFVKGASPPGDGPTKMTFSDFLNLFFFNSRYNVGTVISALSQRGLFQSLAEPNLVAESGKEASFLAGGEFPVPVPQAGAGGLTITIQYKEFGVRLTFVPVVIGDRVHLKIQPEVSSLDFNNAIEIEGFKIPSLTTRRAATELELADGQTFAMAGLINNTMSSTMRKIPGIGDIPILGRLFQSKAAQKDRTELVVMITPSILPLNSPGVTPALPRQPEPYLPPLGLGTSVPAPPPAFEPASVPR